MMIVIISYVVFRYHLWFVTNVDGKARSICGHLALSCCCCTYYKECKRVVCFFLQYSYEANTGEYQASVTIVWNRNHHVDTINVVLYKCDILGSHREHPDCSLCVTRNAKYQCAWCANTCSFSESCLHTPVSECPKPRIDMVSFTSVTDPLLNP